MSDVLKRIAQLRLVPIITLDNSEHAAPLGEALVGGGLPIAEITFRTAAAESAIRTLAKRGDILVGAGTVLNLDTAKRAVDAGAKFIVTPGFNSKVVSWCVANQIPITPGTATPTDVDMALEHGVTTVKFFPAEPLGGIKMLKAISAPFGMMNFLPTGGISLEHVEEYLKFPKVIAVGGSWMASKELLANGDFVAITELSRQGVEWVSRLKPAIK